MFNLGSQSIAADGGKVATDDHVRDVLDVEQRNQGESQASFSAVKLARKA